MLGHRSVITVLDVAVPEDYIRSYLSLRLVMYSLRLLNIRCSIPGY